ncbi:hypothetical protein E2C01_079792 [Portunus trituberculatus]|uniref:Uncharacterized protein n=1 Tax=Portunus trituberculatus TaxID=210409 RepID=A0A5B7IXX4_PORTR|nr:hypothetical protein [Portunus trituberculatus]
MNGSVDCGVCVGKCEGSNGGRLKLLQILAVRRSQLASTGKTEIPVPQTPPPHPGYAPNAAFHAIKRHALEVINQRDAVVST